VTFAPAHVELVYNPEADEWFEQFVPGETEKWITVPVLGDRVQEGDESFSVSLSNPSGALIGDGQATGTILDDDAPVTVSIGDAQVEEGDLGQIILQGHLNYAQFVVSLNHPSADAVSVEFSTADGTATGVAWDGQLVSLLQMTPGPDLDYLVAQGITQGTLTFAPGRDAEGDCGAGRPGCGVRAR
jgi:hypothetical protein